MNKIILYILDIIILIKGLDDILILWNIIINIMQSNRYDHYNDVINIIKEYI